MSTFDHDDRGGLRPPRLTPEMIDAAQARGRRLRSQACFNAMAAVARVCTAPVRGLFGSARAGLGQVRAAIETREPCPESTVRNAA